MSKLRVALAGAWHVHTRGFLAQTIKMYSDQLEWAGVWDHDEARGKAYAEFLNTEYVADYQTLLDDPTIEAILCEAETNLHKDILVRAANAGKHVYTDKALATTVADGLLIKEAVERNGVKFCVSHESLPAAAYSFAKRTLDAGLLGDIVSITFRRAHGLAKQENHLPKNWFSKEVAGGGALIDLGVHGMSMLSHFCGKPKSICGFTHNFTGMETEDSATILVQFENGALGTAHTDMVTNIMENSFEIVGTDGVLVVLGKEGFEYVQLNSKHVPGAENCMKVLTREEIGPDGILPMCQFIGRVLDRENPDQFIPGFDLNTGLSVIRIAEAAYESAATGKAVEFGNLW